MEGQAILLDVTDQGIPKVPNGFPTCPINSPKRIDKVELVPLESIGGTSNTAQNAFSIWIVLCIVQFYLFEVQI